MYWSDLSRIFDLRIYPFKTMNHHLHIYKASAGSGKTFTLAVNYICMLIENPKEYRHILAVTFTNKATAEMKQRILGKLYGIAHNTEDAIPYFEEVKRVTGLDENTIRSHAAQALALLVHDYSLFRIETIDSFFQSVLRGLARELELGTGMTIELDTRKVISEAVDMLLRELKHNDATLSWIQNHISAEIEDGKPWNITDKLKGFATNIHNEDYQRQADALHCQLESDALIKDLRTTLGKQREMASKRIEKRATEFFALINDNGLTIDDFLNKKGGVCGYYIKIQKGEYSTELKGRALTASLEPNGWVGKTAPNRNVILSLASSTLIPHLIETHRICCECVPVINTCDIIRHHLDQLQLINIIHERVLGLNKEANRFLLADTCQMLSRMQTGDSAFVFEKLGYYIRHIMIDEFQDTSRMQWDNFFPLLLEGLSAGHNSLLVGDVKQAIYRWRGSDWRILNEEVTEVLKAYTPSETHHLDTNRRSKEEIVRFNNHLFERCNTILANLLGQQHANTLLHAYSDVAQKWCDGNSGGYVRITDVAPNDDESAKDAMCREVAALINELHQAGIRDEQIAILVRGNKQISYMVDYMARHHADIRIFSAEAYLLESSTAVNMLISALRWLADNGHRPALVQLALDYHRAVLADGIEPSQLLMLEAEGYGLPVAFIEQYAFLRQKPLYELAEELYRILNLETLTHEAGYVMAFFDRLLAYCSESAGDINELLAYWDDELHHAAIPAGAAEGIEAMTIHKSKGLEFHTVILPYCEWELNKYKSTLWVHSDDPLAGSLATIPIEYSAKMQESIFASEHDDERLKQVVDNYNLLYVACTRPRQNLFILKSAPKSDSKDDKKATDPTSINSVGTLISQALGMDGSTMLEFGDTEWNIKASRSQHNSNNKPQKQNKKLNPLEAEATPIAVSMHSAPLSVKFRQSNQSKRYIASTITDEESTQQHYLNQGLLLHEVFSMMRTAKDADSAIDQLIRRGIIDKKASQRIASIVHRALSHPQAADWFSGKYELFNECNIIFSGSDGQTHNLRPDRVMRNGERMIVVDFKFARPHQDHIEQVERYIELLHNMGHNHVEGYVWYGYDNKIIPVL